MMNLEEFFEFSALAINASSRGDHDRAKEAAHKLMDQLQGDGLNAKDALRSALLHASGAHAEIVADLLSLIEGWQNGIFKRMGIEWTENPPAVERAKSWLKGAE